MNGYDLLMACQRLEDERLKVGDKAVLCAISSFFNPKDGCAYPSLEQIQRRSCYRDRDSLIRTIKRLESFGLLTIVRIPGKGNEYRFGNVVQGSQGKPDQSGKTGLVGENRTTPVRESRTTPVGENRTQNTNVNTKEKQSISTSPDGDVAPSPPNFALSLESPKKKQKHETLNFYGLDQQTISDWKAHRKARRAILTQRVIDLHLSEAQKAGISLKDAVEFAIAKGWQAFNAEYYRNATASRPAQSQTPRFKTREEREAEAIAFAQAELDRRQREKEHLPC